MTTKTRPRRHEDRNNDLPKQNVHGADGCYENAEPPKAAKAQVVGVGPHDILSKETLWPTMDANN
jgi:hypothetical protein